MASCILMHMNVIVDLEKEPYLHSKILLKREREMGVYLTPITEKSQTAIQMISSDFTI